MYKRHISRCRRTDCHTGGGHPYRTGTERHSWNALHAVVQLKRRRILRTCHFRYIYRSGTCRSRYPEPCQKSRKPSDRHREVHAVHRSLTEHACRRFAVLVFQGGLAAVDIQNRVKKAESRLPAEVVQNGISVSKETASKLMTITLLSNDPKFDEIYRLWSHWGWRV